MTVNQKKAILEKYGYRISFWLAFYVSAPKDLIERAREFKSSFVVWDPKDNADGFLLCGDNRQELICEAYHVLFEA